MNKMASLGACIQILLLLRILIALAEPVYKEAPCEYKSTVNLSGVKSFANGSYLYQDIIIPPNLTGTYNYKILIANEKIPAEIHVRGCICHLRPCISLCCPPDEEFDNFECVKSDIPMYHYVNVTNAQEGSTVSTNIFQQFAVQIGRPCEHMYMEMERGNSESNYTLFVDGSLFRSADGKMLKRDEYCLSSLYDENLEENALTLVNCFVTEDVSQVKTNGVALLISVPFMIITIIVYLAIPELRTLHGLSFCCYLAGLCLGYMVLAYLIFVPAEHISNFKCSFFGYAAYFGFMSAFFWLSVLSFDLFYNTHGSRSYNEMKRFRLYCLYAWGLALVFLISTYTAQHSTWISKNLKPGIGSEEYCFLNVRYGWSALIYFYGPIIIIISFNTVMFIMTALQIKRGMTLVGSKNTQKAYHEHKNLFLTFLRLFIIMGIIWSAEIISYLTPNDSVFRVILNATDFLNGMQGLIIFVLFVLRKHVRQLILKKFGRSNSMSLDQTEEMTEPL